MARTVSSLVQALDAAIAGEEGHRQVNRMLMLHDDHKAEADLEEYWRLRAKIGRAVDPRDLHNEKGHQLVRQLLSLYDSLDATRGLTSPEQLEIRRHQKDLFWVLRSRIANDIDPS